MQLPNYELHDQLYATDASLVFRATRVDDQLEVIIKIPRVSESHPREAAALRHEYELLRTLDLPGVIRVHGLEQLDDGRFALIEESLGGRPLSELLAAEELDVQARLRVAIGLANILSHLHLAGVVHRDIKPANIIVDPTTFSPHIIDFGIATRLTSASAWESRPDNLEGTLAYMSPEQTGRTYRVLDARSDLYSLGVTLYQLFSGHLPFVSDDVLELVHCHLARVPPALHERAPGLDPMLSAIVAKLMAKDPEQRYQSAAGLQADLEKCQQRSFEQHVDTDFSLGSQDYSPELRIARGVYGRESELDILRQAVLRTARGRPEVVFIGGYSGVGKSALVHALHRPIAAARGWFVAGKFDPHDRFTPNRPLAASLRMLVRQLLSERDTSLIRWRTRLLDALGGNAALLLPLVPELELVLGPLPEPPELSATAAQNRFRLTFVAFLRCFAQADRPLVLFLDDLQWMDTSSLQLLEHVMTSADAAYLLVIGAYRDNEVDATHPVARMIERLAQHGSCSTHLKLSELGLEHTQAWLADTLHTELSRVETLAQVVHNKTHGNPFFVGQFLRELEQRGLIFFDHTTKLWTWDTTTIADADVTDNVAELMVRKLSALAPNTQDTIKRAACLGHTFELAKLATIADLTDVEVAQSLAPAVDVGMIVALDAGHRLLAASARSEDSGLDIAVHYRFLHDRVQQAAYAMIEDDTRIAWHSSIGRLLRTQLSQDPEDDAIFACVRNLNAGASAIVDAEVRLDAARLNLEAGRRARAASAHAAAAEMMRAGRAFLGSDAWAQHRDLAYALELERAACASMAGLFDDVDELTTELLQRAKTRHERVEINAICLRTAVRRGDLDTAYAIGCRVCEMFGDPIPSEPEALQTAVYGAFGLIAELIDGRTPAQLLDLPQLDNPELLAYQKFLLHFIGLVFVINRHAYPLPVAAALKVSLRHGHSKYSPHAYSSYGSMLAAGMHQYPAGRAFGDLALALDERFNSVAIRANVLLTTGAMLIYTAPLEQSLARCRQAMDVGLTTGDFVYAGYGALLICNLGLSQGHPLDALDPVFAEAESVLARIRDPLSIANFAVTRQAANALRGKTNSLTDLNSADYDHSETMARSTGDPITLARAYSIELQLHVLAGSFERARELAPEALPHADAAVSNFFQSEILTNAALALLTVPAAERRVPEDFIDNLVGQLKTLAEACPPNFAHKHALLLAEMARARGDTLEAMRLYDEAISGARTLEFLQDEALACERAAQMYLKLGRTRIARAYLFDAYTLYSRWGATAVVARLADAHADLLPKLGPAPSTRDPLSNTLASLSLSNSVLDMTSLIRAGQTIASEIMLDKLVEHILRIVLTSAGAKRCVLLLSQGDRIHVYASISVSPDALTLDLNDPLDSRNDLPRSAIRYAARTHEIVNLDRRTGHDRFANDPFFDDNAPHSIVCLPLTHQSRLVGVLYLENEETAQALSPHRIEILRLLSTQAANALENATLYAELERSREMLREHNRRLSDEVQQQTAELASTNRQLRNELKNRALRERENADLQAEVIKIQKQRLQELSTPLIPITEAVVIMPLIGSMDSQRARQVTEVALMGVKDRGARVVILDVTGMSTIDTATADKLIRCAKGLRLLGAETIISGIQPMVARVLVELGIDFKLATCQSLHDALAHALTLTDEFEQLRGRSRLL